MKLDLSEFAKAAAQAYVGHQAGKLQGMQYRQQQEQQDFARQMQVFPMLANLESQERERTLEPFRTAANAPNQTPEGQAQTWQAFADAQQRLGQSKFGAGAFQQFVGGSPIGQQAFKGMPPMGGQPQAQGSLPTVPKPQFKDPNADLDQKALLGEIEELRTLALKYGESGVLSGLAGLGSKVYRKEVDPKVARADLAALSAPLLEKIQQQQKDAAETLRLSKEAQVLDKQSLVEDRKAKRAQAKVTAETTARDKAIDNDRQNVKLIEDAFSSGADPKTTRELIKRQRAFANSPEGQKHGLVPYGGEVFSEVPRKLPTKLEVQAFERGTQGILRRLGGQTPPVELIDSTRDETPEEVDARQLAEIASRIQEGPAQRRYLEAGLNGLKSLLTSSRWDTMTNAEREGVIENGNRIAEQLGLPAWLPAGLKANTLPPRVREELELKKQALVERKRAVDESIRYHDALIRQADARLAKSASGAPGSADNLRKQEIIGLREQLDVQSRELAALNKKTVLTPSQEERVGVLQESTKTISQRLESLWSAKPSTGAGAASMGPPKALQGPAPQTTGNPPAPAPLVFKSRGAFGEAVKNTPLWKKKIGEGYSPTEILDALLATGRFRIGAQ